MTKQGHSEPLILGFNGSHDGSVALLTGGKILGTISCERITRKKKDGNGNQKFLIDRLLNRFSVSVEDIDYIAFCDNYLDPETAYFQCLDPDGTIHPKSNIYGQLRPDHQRTDCYQSLYTEILDRRIPSYFVNHHLGHIAYSYYTSHFDKALCLSLDGSPAEYSMSAKAKANSISQEEVNHLQTSLVYDSFTYYTLGNPLFKAGSMMGLSAHAPYSKEIDLQTLLSSTIEESWKLLTGNEPQKITKPRTQVNETDIKVASTIQHLFEQEITQCLSAIPDNLLKDYDYNLCLSGGSFLNCKLNGILKRNSSFENIHIAPACGDDGLAIGAALYTAHSILNLPRHHHEPSELMYSGQRYDVDSTVGEKYNESVIVDLLLKGKIIGFFHGKSEFGPRALGNRSLLADPRSPKMKDYLNKVVKHREWFRPYGASVLKEEASNWFSIDSSDSPFMLKAYPVLRPEKIPAVTHVDCTSRIQTVDAKENQKFYSLIESFYKQSSIPMLLNTSLNDSEEPIVETPEDALRLFDRSPIDALVLEDRMLLKGQPQ
jgi:carbamoyltransferase